jgi:hypothetical protein
MLEKQLGKKKEFQKVLLSTDPFEKRGLLEGIRLIDDILFTLTYNIV